MGLGWVGVGLGLNWVWVCLGWVYHRAHRSSSKSISENGGSDLLINSLSDRIFDLEQGKQIIIFVDGGLD